MYFYINLQALTREWANDIFLVKISEHNVGKAGGKFDDNTGECV